MEFKFSNGATGKLKPVPPLLRTYHANKMLPKPQPPMQDTPLGPIANPDHPAYVQALEEWGEKKELFFRKLYLELGVEIEVPKGEVEAYRELMRDVMGTELEGSDKFIYLSCLCIQTDEEWNRLLTQLITFAQPTEEAVQEHLDTFPAPARG